MYTAKSLRILVENSPIRNAELKAAAARAEVEKLMNDMANAAHQGKTKCHFSYDISQDAINLLESKELGFKYIKDYIAHNSFTISWQDP